MKKTKAKLRLPETLQLEISEIDDEGEIWARPTEERFASIGQIIVLSNRKIKPPLAVGDRVLVRIDAKNGEYYARVMLRTSTAQLQPEKQYGVIEKRGGRYFIVSTEKSKHTDLLLDNPLKAKDGDFVAYALEGNRRFKEVRILRNFGPFSLSKAAELLVLEKYGIPNEFKPQIAKELGIAEDPSQCVMGKEIDNLSPEELQELCKNVRVFARVSPENKVAIVKAFKANGNICAMTGDGVNDAPSLKAADIGIAMGITGTDVAKGAADMVLTDDNFASIEKAVEEGRGIYANIKKTVVFLLSSNIAEVLGMFFIICIGFPTPFIAIHLLWVNLITDSLPAIALGMDPKDPKNMEEKPRDPKEGILSNGGLRNTVLFGAIITVAVLISYFVAALVSPEFYNGGFADLGFTGIKDFYMTHPDQLHEAQTMAFTTLAVSELFHMIGMSDMNRSFIYVFAKKNWMMLVAFIAGLALQLFVICVPGVQQVFSTTNLTVSEWLITCALAVLPLIAHEIYVFINWLIKRSNSKKEVVE